MRDARFDDVLGRDQASRLSLPATVRIPIFSGQFPERSCYAHDSCSSSSQQQQQQRQQHLFNSTRLLQSQQQQQQQLVWGGGNEEPLLGHSRYMKIRDLNRGAFGFVQLVRDKLTGEEVAIKFVRPADNPLVNRYIQSEAVNHRNLKHPCVIGFKEVIAVDGYIGIIMEYASGGSLFSHLKHAGHFSEPVARWFFQQLIIGLDHCHQRGVVNRDIKLNNMLVQVYPGQQRLPSLKIADFGYSKAHSAGHPTTKVGTLPYMAPEIFRANGAYDGHKSDIWSCGVMLAWMLFGRHPFQPESYTGGSEGYWRAMLKNILNNKWAIPSHIHLSDACQDLLLHIFKDLPAQRISIQEIYEHPWFVTDLPVEAEAMKHGYVGQEDYTGLQNVDDIRSIIQHAVETGGGFRDVAY